MQMGSFFLDLSLLTRKNNCFRGHFGHCPGGMLRVVMVLSSESPITFLVGGSSQLVSG